MASTAEPGHREQIRRVLERINDAWLEGRSEELGEYLHPDIAIVSPDLRRLGEGSEACVKSYHDFASRATVNGFTMSDPVIDLWRDTAVAVYSFDIDYEMSGRSHRESGRDLYVFTRDGGKWRAAWRMLTPGPVKD